MSTKEVERFIADLKSDSSLQEALKGAVSGVDAVIAFARQRGYDISREDVKAHLSALSGQDIGDEQLDAVAGGKASAQTVTETSVVETGVITILGPNVETHVVQIAVEVASTAQTVAIT